MKIKPLDFCEETIDKKRFLEGEWLTFCGRLKEIRDLEMYKGRWDSFEDFLNDQHMNMDKSTASRMITIHEVLIGEYKIKPEKIVEAGGWSKVAEILPVIVGTDKKNAEIWLETAASLSKNDLRKEVRSVHNGQSECKHKDTYEITIRICRTCDHKETIKTTE